MLEAKDFRARARETLRGNWGPAILVCFLAVLLGGIGSADIIKVNFDTSQGWTVQFFEYFKYSVREMSFLTGNVSLPIVGALLPGLVQMAGILAVAQFFIGGAVQLGVCSYFIKNAMGQNPDWKEEFSYFQYFGKALALRIVTSIFIFLWTLLLIIPGIIAAYRYSMASYILAENPQMDFMDAIRQSGEMMDGRKADKFWLDLTFIGWEILGLLAFGLGFILLNPYEKAAEAHFYLNAKTEDARGGDNL